MGIGVEGGGTGIVGMSSRGEQGNGRTFHDAPQMSEKHKLSIYDCR